MYKWDKDKIKNELTIDQVADLLSEFGGEPIIEGDVITAKTICHNQFGEDCSHKLYYYDNSHLFNCYTNCGSFDIFQLVCNVKNINEEPKIYYTEEGKMATREWTLGDALQFIAIFYGISSVVDEFDIHTKRLSDEDIFDRYDKIKEITELKKDANLRIFDKDILDNLPTPYIEPWGKEGITKEIMDMRKICYDPVLHGIVIPHYNINGDLIGIRERTLVKEQEAFGKYRPAIIGGKMYNHPLGFNLYNLNFSKDNISRIKKAIIWEGEKSSLLYASIFGAENDITVACCGSSLTSFQISLLKELDVQEIIIGFDRQFKELGDDEWKRWTKKLENIHTKHGKDVQISFLFDKENLLDYKDSPIDKGKDVFLKLFKERVIL